MIHTDNNIPYEDIDIELQELAKLLNKFAGIETTSCCFGHYKKPCRIYFEAETIDSLNNLMFKVFDYEQLWEISVDTADYPENYPYIRLVLHSKGITKYPTVGLMVDNLAYRLAHRLEEE